MTAFEKVIFDWMLAIFRWSLEFGCYFSSSVGRIFFFSYDHWIANLKGIYLRFPHLCVQFSGFDTIEMAMGHAAQSTCDEMFQLKSIGKKDQPNFLYALTWTRRLMHALQWQWMEVGVSLRCLYHVSRTSLRSRILNVNAELFITSTSVIVASKSRGEHLLTPSVNRHHSTHKRRQIA